VLWPAGVRCPADQIMASRIILCIAVQQHYRSIMDGLVKPSIGYTCFLSDNYSLPNFENRVVASATGGACSILWLQVCR
jgi:hypothetical protein